MSSAQAFPAPAAATSKHSPAATLLPRFAWAVLVYNIPVILWGAVVRATSSGAGCGDHWPLCNGVVLQTNPRLATLIELAHRVSSGVTLPLVLLLLLWTFRSTVSGHLARIATIAAVVFTFNEALLGALLVLLRLTADNRSPARAVYLSLHLAHTLLLLGALTLAAHFLSRGEAFTRRTIRFTQMPLAVTGITATLVLGVTGTLAALSDTLFPATSLSTAFAQDFSASGGWLLRLRILHPLTAVIAGLFICWLLLRSIARPAEHKLALLVLGLLVLQFALGIADVTLLAPVWLQIVHLLGADLLWIALVVLAARVCIRGEDSGHKLTSPSFHQQAIS
jgi:cytochrome c oxidase assembly protein subunit 15